jgi:DNA-binding transcriptional MerR regulator
MRIGELSARSGVSPRSLRYYEQLGLIGAERSANGYRDYADAVVERAAAIHLVFEMGFPRDVVETVLRCVGDAPAAVHAEVAEQLGAVRAHLDERIRHLRSTRERIDEFLETHAVGG